MAVSSFSTEVGKGFYVEDHGHRLSRAREISDLSRCTWIYSCTCVGSRSRVPVGMLC